MNVLDIYEKQYKEYCDVVDDDDTTKYEWAANEVFDLSTYDSHLNNMFAKKLFEVLKVILERRNFEYIQDDDNYLTYIIACQLFNNFGWIDWGTSIRGAWFESYHPGRESKPIFTRYMDGVWEEIRPTKDNIKALIEFVEG